MSSVTKSALFLAPARGSTFQRRRVASQTKPMEHCHPERSEGSLSGERSFAALRMTKRDGLLCEMYYLQGVPWGPGDRVPIRDARAVITIGGENINEFVGTCAYLAG